MADKQKTIFVYDDFSSKQRATVKTEMNGFTPSLDRRPPSR